MYTTLALVCFHADQIPKNARMGHIYVAMQVPYFQDFQRLQKKE